MFGCKPDERLRLVNGNKELHDIKFTLQTIPGEPLFKPGVRSIALGRLGMSISIGFPEIGWPLFFAFNLVIVLDFLVFWNLAILMLIAGSIPFSTRGGPTGLLAQSKSWMRTKFHLAANTGTLQSQRADPYLSWIWHGPDLQH